MTGNHQKLGFCRIIRMEESTVLTEFIERMIRITDDLVDQIKEGQLDGEFHFHQNSLQSAAAGETVSLELLCEMLYERPEIAGVELCGDEVYVTVSPEFAVHEDDSNLHALTQTEVDIICALHTLWLNHAGGEQADFTDCLLKGINLTSRNLDRAVFTGAKLVDCIMYDTRVNTAIFDDAKLQNCQLMNAQAEHCSFRNAFIIMTDLDTANTRHSNFIGATISKYSVPKDDPLDWSEESQNIGLTM